MSRLPGYDEWLDKVSYESSRCSDCDDDVGEPSLLDDDGKCRHCLEGENQ